jgi:hypothetical protein
MKKRGSRLPSWISENLLPTDLHSHLQLLFSAIMQTATNAENDTPQKNMGSMRQIGIRCPQDVGGTRRPFIREMAAAKRPKKDQKDMKGVEIKGVLTHQ